MPCSDYSPPCVNVGCVPSKTLLWAAELLHTSQHHGIPGLEFDVKRLDFGAIVRDELALVERMRRDKYATVLQELEHVTFVRSRSPRHERAAGCADYLVDPHAGEVPF